MAKNKREEKAKTTEKLESPEDRKKTITGFLLMFPSMIIGFMAIVGSQRPLWFSGIVIALEILNWILISQFIQDFYKYN